MPITNYLKYNGYNWDGSKSENKIVKSISAQVGWKPSKTERTADHLPEINNSTGFSGFPLAIRDGLAYYIPTATSFGTVWWSTEKDTKHDDFGIYFNNDSNDESSFLRSNYLGSGYPVYLVKD